MRPEKKAEKQRRLMNMQAALAPQPDPVRIDVNAYPLDDATEKLVAALRAQDYTHIRVLEDGVICLAQMLYTWAVIVDAEMYGYAKRFCYPDKAKAIDCLMKMRSVDDAPLPGYTAIK